MLAAYWDGGPWRRDVGVREDRERLLAVLGALDIEPPVSGEERYVKGKPYGGTRALQDWVSKRRRAWREFAVAIERAGGSPRPWGVNPTPPSSGGPIQGSGLLRRHAGSLNQSPNGGLPSEPVRDGLLRLSGVPQQYSNTAPCSYEDEHDEHEPETPCQSKRELRPVDEL
jgi:hypothetical protein